MGADRKVKLSSETGGPWGRTGFAEDLPEKLTFQRHSLLCFTFAVSRAGLCLRTKEVPKAPYPIAHL